MKSKVYFTPIVSDRIGILEKIDALIKKIWPQDLGRGDITAVKIHFGEEGNSSFINPKYAERAVCFAKSRGALPFLTDTNTLYKGTRSTTPDHIATAVKHGFTFDTLGSAVIIADGLRGENYINVDIDKKYYKSVKIGAEIALADALVVLTHFKGHELTGFGGSIKNIGMGCACREGKLSQHSTASPFVGKKSCTGCGTCIENCAFEAITLIDTKASINPEKCSGCSQCIVVCPEGAIRIHWNESADKFQKKMAEHALGAVKGKEGKLFFMNFLINITPVCDCFGHNKPRIMDDIGVLASRDPVAIDRASIDLVNSDGRDRFREIYPEIDWRIQLRYSEEIGLGREDYELIEI